MLRKGDLWKARADCTKDITAGALEHFVQLLARKWSYSGFISILHNLPKILEIWFVPAEMNYQDNHSGFVAVNFTRLQILETFLETRRSTQTKRCI